MVRRHRQHGGGRGGRRPGGDGGRHRPGRRVRTPLRDMGPACPRPGGRGLEGFVLNKFRGDPDLLAPAPDDLEAVTGVPTVGVLPWLDHGLPDEEGPTPIAGPGRGPQVSIVCGPYCLEPRRVRPAAAGGRRRVGAGRRPARAPADLIILPGSKHVADDLGWLRRTGLAGAVTRAADDGTPVLGVCGGLQMLGRRIEDPDGVEGAAVGPRAATGGDPLPDPEAHGQVLRPLRTAGTPVVVARSPLRCRATRSATGRPGPSVRSRSCPAGSRSEPPT